nr:MAG TPA: hypothetical protein [Caudoviricetes sp.]
MHMFHDTLVSFAERRVISMEIAVFVAGVFTGIIATIVFALCAAGGDDD